jgi:hypothetical protein
MRGTRRLSSAVLCRDKFFLTSYWQLPNRRCILSSQPTKHGRTPLDRTLPSQEKRKAHPPITSSISGSTTP